jgi:hypothetical protein
MQLHQRAPGLLLAQSAKVKILLEILFCLYREHVKMII